MRIAVMVAALLLGTGLAEAQVVSPLGGSTNNPPAPAAPAAAAQSPAATPDTSTPATRTARPHRARRTLAQQFEEANTTHDGHLTLEQARAGHMNAVVRDFDAIDTAKRGYVTLDDIRAFRKQRRAARRAARASKPE